MTHRRFPARILLAFLLSLTAMACGRGADPDGTPAVGPMADVEGPPEGQAAPAPDERATALAEIEAERARVAATLDRGSLDETSVPAYRLRDLTRAFAAQAKGLGVAEARRLAASAAEIGEATLAIESAATRGDLGAARERFAEMQASLRAFTGAAERAEVRGLAAAMESRSVSLRGEIIDPQCFFTHDGRGADHAACAVFCAKGGQDLAFLDESDGRVYPLIAATHGMDPNHGLYPYVGRAVDMQGMLFRRGPTAFLIIQRVDGREVVATEAP